MSAGAGIEPLRPTWATAFLDLAPGAAERVVPFWCAVTGYALSPWRGEHDEFATLLPPDGADDHLCVQRLGRLDTGPWRVHLDLTVAAPGEDVGPAAVRAVALGARVQAGPEGYAVLSSPGGFVFCLVSHPGARRAAPATWPGGHRSVLDQVCLDVPAELWEAECAFWAALTGWELRESDPEFRHLVRPEGFPVRVLLQRLDDPAPAVSAHLDLAADDRAAEVARHETLGARVLATCAQWTVLADPVGTAYCVTDRRPGS
ncbi:MULTISPECIES: VOC family protein [unclassified Nocardioides]|uniref:VOC family protein n=1 Tax=unclassified Nocardioides TaxID=2615069 RepID=UPI0018864291|nr:MULTISPECIES: VOC family protein [unclassified Nocardioides]